MAYYGDINGAGYGSNFVGVIIMSDRERKTECLKRKLFGLPASMVSFIRKVKAGMPLFLYEYEEKKLYGVFEATCDGAVNIVPDAFTSSGKFFPAQILFKRIWMCKPLSEYEFRDAIKENYYNPSRFHFYLSNEQVSKLLHLFSKKKINLEQDQIPVVNHTVLNHFERSGLGNFKRIGRGRYMNFGSNKHYWNNYSSRCTSRSWPYCKPILASADCMAGVEHRFYPSVPGAPELQLNLMNPTTQNDHVQRGNIFICRTCSHCYHQMTLGSRGELSLAKENTAGVSSSLESQAIQVRSDVHQSQSNPALFPLASTNCNCSMNVSTNLRTQKDISSPINEPMKISSPFTGSEGNADLRDHESIPFSDRYDPSDSAASIPLLVTTEMNGTDSLISMSGPSGAHCNPESSHSKDGSGVVDLKLYHDADFIPLPDDDDFVKDMESPPTSSTLQKHASDKKDNSDSEEDDKECYPTSQTSRLRSDSHQERTSVFSRLSMVPEAPQPVMDPRRPCRDLSSEQLIRLLSQRRYEWNNMNVAPDHNVFKIR